MNSSFTNPAGFAKVYTFSDITTRKVNPNGSITVTEVIARSATWESAAYRSLTFRCF